MLQNLDRARWTFAEALEHIEEVLVAHWIAEGRPKPERIWGDMRDAETRVREEAREQLLVALRDGYLLADGRLSTERNWGALGVAHEWIMHALAPEPIGPRHWHGRADSERLVFPEGEYIDIRVLRVMVLTIWPTYVPPLMRKSVGAPSYTTPYLALMHEAMEHFSLSEDRQEKKDCLFRWFLTKSVEGKRVSKNLAGGMATLIRLPGAQCGGSKRVIGPDLRRAG